MLGPIRRKPQVNHVLICFLLFCYDLVDQPSVVRPQSTAVDVWILLLPNHGCGEEGASHVAKWMPAHGGSSIQLTDQTEPPPPASI
jgi:hypothetical protein